jgi:hypothetical protein
LQTGEEQNEFGDRQRGPAAERGHEKPAENIYPTLNRVVQLKLTHLLLLI